MKGLFVIFKKIVTITLGVLSIIFLLVFLLTPVLNQKKEYFEKWFSTFLHTSVQIDSVRARWVGIGPDLLFRHVSAYDPHSKQLIIRIDELKVRVNIWNYLFAKQLKPRRLTLSGVHLIVNQKEYNRFQLQGFPLSIPRFDAQKLTHFESKNRLFAFLFNEPRLSLKQISIDVHKGSYLVNSILFTQIHVMNRGSHHVLTGRAQLLKPHQTTIQFGVSLEGTLQNQSQWDALIYLQAQEMVCPTSLKKWVIGGYHLQEGRLKQGQFWLRWHHQKWQSVQGIVDLNNLNLQQSQRHIQLNHFAGNILWRRMSQGWQLSGDKVFLETKRHQWPIHQFVLRVQDKTKPQQMMWIKSVSLETLKDIVDQVPIPFLKKLSVFNIKGHLNDCFMTHLGAFWRGSQYYIETLFDSLQTTAFSHWPGVKGLSGILKTHDQEGWLVLNTHHLVEVNFKRLFLKPLQCNTFVGQIHWNKDHLQHWKIKINHFLAANQHAALDGSVGLAWDVQNKFPVISMLSSFHIDNASALKDYWPMSVFSKKLVQWLNHAFLKSRDITGTLVLKGPLHDFPFDAHQGTFIVDSNLNQLDFHYAVGWPEVKKINGRVMFQGRTMTSDVQSAVLQGAPVHSIHAEIPNLSHGAHVNIQGNVNTSIDQLLTFLKQGPLKLSWGHQLAGVIGTGSAPLDLSLSIPIANTAQTRVNGTLHLNSVNLRLKPWDIPIDQIQGHIGFDEKSITSGAFHGKLDGVLTPFTIQPDSQDPTLIHLRFQGLLNQSIIQKYGLSLPFVEGQAPYQATVSLQTAQKKAVPSQLTLDSDLGGIRLNLPKPFQKESVEKWPSHLSFSFDRGQIPHNFLLKIPGRVILASHYQQGAWWNTRLHFGESPLSPQKEKGFWVSGTLPTLSVDAWKSFLLPSAHSFKNSHWWSQLKHIDLSVRKMEFLRQSLVNTHFQMTPDIAHWIIDIDNQNIAGQLRIPFVQKNTPISGHFDRLVLTQIPYKGADDLQHLPDLKLSIDDFQYLDRAFGKVSLETQFDLSGLSIKHLGFEDPVLSADLQGSWQKSQHGPEKSEIFGEVSTDKLNRLLKRENIEIGVLGSTGQAHLKLAWPGAIYKPQWDKMTGDIAFQLGAGRIIAVDEKNAAKLNLGFVLSLLSVRRLLNMDFADLTHHGFSFDRLKGEAHIDKGFVLLHHLYFDGSTARIEASGSLDIHKKTLDLNVIVMPYITSSLPVVATLAGGPVAGALTWLADKVFGQEVSKMTRYHYHVFGNFSHPVIKALKQ